MGKRIFKTAKEAYAFGKSISVENKTITKIYEINKEWFVEGDFIKDEIDFSSTYLNIRNLLKDELSRNENLTELIDLFELNNNFLDHKSIFESQLSQEIKEFLALVPKLLEQLECLKSYIDDLPKVKTKQYAIDMAYEFNDIAESLDGFKISDLARRYKMQMISKSTTLDSEVGLANDYELSKIITRLEAQKGKCKKPNCEGRYVIRGENGYFWGCSLFPKCWTRFKLTPEENDLLR